MEDAAAGTIRIRNDRQKRKKICPPFPIRSLEKGRTQLEERTVGLPMTAILRTRKYSRIEQVQRFLKNIVNHLYEKKLSIY